MHENDTKDRPVRDTATVTVTKPVDGSKVQRKRHGKNVKRAIKTTLALSDCDPRVVEVAQSARKPGQLLRVVSPNEIHVVNA